MARSFPCPICKGVGDFQDGDYVDVGIGMVQVSQDNPCYYCEKNGMIEIGSDLHERIKLRETAWKMYHVFGKTDKEYGAEHTDQIRAKLEEIKNLM